MSTPICCGFSPSVSGLYTLYPGLPNTSVFTAENSCSGISSSVTVSLPSSIRIFPLSSVTSNRFLPGKSPVEVTNTPVAPFSYSARMVTSSSTSISCQRPKLIFAVIAVGIPQIHCHRSRLCGH